MDRGILKYMAFIKTVELKSFTKAASVLNYSQSGISRMINDLEEEWGVTLLERSRAGVKLTSSGIRLLPYAKSLCLAYDGLQKQIDELNGIDSGLIRIGTFSSIASHRLPHIIKRFRRDFPGIDYEILMGDYDEITQWVTEGRVDIGFICRPVTGELEIYDMERDQYFAILPRNHRLAGLSKISLNQLVKEPFILSEKGNRQDVTQIFSRYGLVPDVHFTTWDDYAIIAMVESGLGVSILPQLILNRMPYDVVKKELDIPQYRDIVYIMRNKQSAVNAVSKFTEYIVEDTQQK